MKKILAKYGWPGRSLVGTDAARAAWLIVLHADSDAVFQRQGLELMKTLPACEVENKHIAYLTDRTLINEELIYKDGKKQEYGTVLINENGKLVPKPIWEEANVDKRREELGLQPLAEYIRRKPLKQSLVSSNGAAEHRLVSGPESARPFIDNLPLA